MWQTFVNWLIFKFFKLGTDSFLGKFLAFLVYDFFKIILMVTIIMFLVAFVRSFLDKGKFDKLLRRNFLGLNYFLAAFLGAVTPFCSCSGIPIFIGMIEAGVPLGVSIAFLVTSPIVNEVVIILMGNYYGWNLAFIYAGLGILLGVVSGLIIEKLGLDKELILKSKHCCCAGDATDQCCSTDLLQEKLTSFKQRLIFAFTETKRLVKDIWLFIFLGVSIGALIHNVLPEHLVKKYTGGKNWWTVPLAVLLGIPMYAGCSTVAPAIFSITSQGVELGTSLALLMAISGLSLPEAMFLKSSMSLKLLLIFFTIVSIGIILIGYLFNYLY